MWRTQVEEDKAKRQWGGNGDTHTRSQQTYARTHTKTRSDLIRFPLPFSSPSPPIFLGLTISLLINSCFPCYEADGRARRGMQNNSCDHEAARNELRTEERGERQCMQIRGGGRSTGIKYMFTVCLCTMKTGCKYSICDVKLHTYASVYTFY